MKEEDLLIKKAKHGKGEAFGKLYDKYLSRIYRFVFLKVGRREDAEDLTHQVFLSAWQNINRYESRGFPFSTWLYRIAHNAVIDYYRTWKNMERLENVEETLATGTDHSERIDQALDMETAKAALVHLEPDQQNILIMKFVDDLSNKEVAEILGKSEGAIRVIQHRALRQLKKYVDEQTNNPTTKEA